MSPVQFQNHARKLRALACNNNCKIYFLEHASKQMKLRGINKTDVNRILKTGAVIRVEPDDEDPEYEKLTVTGRNIDGAVVEIVVLPVEDGFYIEIVTAY